MKNLKAIEATEWHLDVIKAGNMPDRSIGQIVCKWLSEGDNISEAMEVINGFGREQMIEFFRLVSSGDECKMHAGYTFQEAVGQAPYARDILSMLVKQVEDKLEKQAAIAKYEE